LRKAASTILQETLGFKARRNEGGLKEEDVGPYRKVVLQSLRFWLRSKAAA
jgi:hypothetical protein